MESLLPFPRSPWSDAPPHGEKIDLNEYPSILKNMRLCRSFRSDLRHKLEIIIRAHGGYGLGGMKGAARTLGVHRQTIRGWRNWRSIPASLAVWERIDNIYEDSLRILAAKKARRGRARPPAAGLPAEPRV